MKKHRVFSVLLAALMLLCALQCVAFAADGETLLHGEPLQVVSNPNGFGMHLQTPDGKRVAAAYPAQGLSGRKKAPVKFPERYDSRDLGLVTPVKDQDASGICWAFSVISCLETNAMKKQLAPADVDYSESHLAWFSINSKTTDKNDRTYGDGERANFNTIYQTGGNSAYAIASIARGSGVALESDFNFKRDFLGFKTYQEKDRYVSELHMSQSDMLDCFEDQDKAALMADVKRAIMEYGSVSMSFYASGEDKLYYNSMLDGTEVTSYYQDRTSDPNDADHMVTVVGWDDNYSVEHFNPEKRPKNPGAWIIKNSWGIGGEGPLSLPDGYLYISYEDGSLCEFVTYEAMDKNAYDKMYQYDGFFYSASFPMEAEERAAYANIFTADEDGYLNKIGFYTAAGNETVDVSVYRNLSNLTVPDSGDEVCTVRVQCPYSGYHTVDLTRLAAVKKGETFSAIVRAANGSTMDVPVEANYIGSNNYAAKDGQSFIFFADGDNGQWYPASDFSSRSIIITASYTVCNVPVKAMALSADRHTHQWMEGVSEIPANCVRDGGKVRACKDCDALDYVERIPAKGHTDGNNDGTCDACGATMNTPDSCPYCHKVHGKGLDRIVAFFHRILAFFRNLFQR